MNLKSGVGIRELGVCRRVLGIRIPSDQHYGRPSGSVVDPELLPGSGSGIKVPDPDPAKSEREYK